MNTGLLIAFTAATAAGLLLTLPVTSGVRFEQAMLTSTSGDGEYLLAWLVFYRLGLVSDPLRLGDAAYNRRLLSEGMARLGRHSPCAAYRDAAVNGTLRPLALPWSPPMLAYAHDLLARWSATCGASS